MAGLLAAVRRRYVASACLLATLAWAIPAAAQMRDSIPSQIYYGGIEELYAGQYRDAQRTFVQALRGSVKTVGPTGQVRWVDSICYHAMLGETLFQWGRPAAALDEFNLACSIYLQYPNWMMQVEFPRTAIVVDPRLARMAPPWGASRLQLAPGRFVTAYPLAMGQIDNSNVVRNGGVVQQAQYWQVNVYEIERCLALAIRRRNEILGPLGAFDPVSKRVLLQLSRGGAPPNHWSAAWVSVVRGVAHAGVGEAAQAIKDLSEGTRIGDFSHPLTSVALVEQGRLAMEAGDFDAAADLLAEASYSAFVFGDGIVLDDAFRWSEENNAIAGNLAAGPSPALGVAAQWARRQRLGQVAARLNLAIAEDLMAVHNWQGATAALATGQSLLADARTGILGVQAAYLAAVLECQGGRNTGPAKLAQAVSARAAISVKNYQIGLANSMFDNQTLPTRSAPQVYGVLLADPSPAEQAGRPLDAMAVMATDHDDAFDRWLGSAVEKRDFATAVDIADRAKRRRFHAAQALGGRLAAVRDLTCEPDHRLSPAALQLRGELLGRQPALKKALADATGLRDELAAAWVAEPTKEQAGKLARQWEDYATALDRREAAVRQAALERTPAAFSFPPLLPTADLQSRLRPGQAMLVYHETSGGLLGFLITPKAAAAWNCGPTGPLAGAVTTFLRDLGNYDGNREMTTDQLVSDDWHASSAKVYEGFLNGSSLEASGLNELIVVPDGVAWYVPFEALWVKGRSGKEGPLLSTAKVRYAPTAGLAFSFQGPWRRIQRTGVLVGDLVPGEDDKERAAAAEQVEAALTGPITLERQGAAPAVAAASILDALVVLADVDSLRAGPLDWAPLPIGRNEEDASLSQWLTLAHGGPQRILLPGMHTPAERGGRAARRKESAVVSGNELFMTSCSLMAAGAETALLSRWRVGGQSTLDLMREFLQEAPTASAAEAWQRSVQVAMETPVDPVNELRVKPGKKTVELTAAHPFFWAGYLVVDSGWAPPEEEDLAAGDPAAKPAEAGGDDPFADAPVKPGPAKAGAAKPAVPAEAAAKEQVEEPPTVAEKDAAEGAASHNEKTDSTDEQGDESVPPPPSPPSSSPQ